MVLLRKTLKRYIVVCTLYAVLCTPVYAAVNYGVDTVSSEWFREWYQWGELRHYLDNHSDVSVYQVETTGEWAAPEPLIVSLNGNSYRWTKYYLNGFRVDSRTEAGDALYTPDMFAHSMAIDYNRGAMYWTTDSVRPHQVRISGQGGNIGSYSYSAKWLQELQEGNSAVKRLESDVPLRLRKHTVGAGHADVTYGIPANGVSYTQHVYADYGVRRQLRYAHDGIAGTYDADYYHVQLDGQLQVAPNSAFDALHYILRAGYRADGYTEFGYNENEASQQLNHSFSFYGNKDYGHAGILTTGLTYALRRDAHRDRSFQRNIIDVDGEAFEPWYADGHTHELNWAVDYRYRILPWLHLHLDGYNSFLSFAPSQSQWTNSTCLMGYNMASPLMLSDYRWESRAFAAGMLENTVSLEADYAVLPWLRLRGAVSATMDGLLVRGKSLVTPSWEAKADIHIEPAQWFRMDLIAANYRIPYTYEQVRFLSDDYLSGEVYYAGTDVLLTTTGGKYHRLNLHLRQPQYVAVDVPIIFTIGRHEISILSSFKKYYNIWSVRLADESAGSFEADGDVWRMKPQERYYVVTQASPTGTGIWDSPVFASNVVKYAYNGRKVFVSLSWQSECLSGASALGNSVQAEDINVLSETLASPNMQLVATNTGQKDAGVRSLGRLHQDRAYIAHLQLGVNITENWQLSMSGKFRDGIPFTHYVTKLSSDASGHTQAIVWNGYSRGINVVDDNFGQRTDSFFNFDLRLKYRGHLCGVPFSVQAVCYNIWDFATELNENCVYYDASTGDGFSLNRAPLSLCTPRGLLLTLSVGLEKSSLAY